MRTNLGLIIAAFLLLIAAPDARASTITTTLSFVANFVGAPVNTVKGSFTLTFDPADSFANSSTGITLNYYSLNLGSTLVYDHIPDGFDYGGVTIGGLSGDANSLDLATDDFFFSVSNIRPSAYYDAHFAYSVAFGGYYYPTSLTVTVSPGAYVPPVTTPLPATAWLFLTALGGLGLIVARRGWPATAAASPQAA